MDGAGRFLKEDLDSTLRRGNGVAGGKLLGGEVVDDGEACGFKDVPCRAEFAAEYECIRLQAGKQRTEGEILGGKRRIDKHAVIGNGHRQNKGIAEGERICRGFGKLDLRVGEKLTGKADCTHLVRRQKRAGSAAEPQIAARDEYRFLHDASLLYDAGYAADCGKDTALSGSKPQHMECIDRQDEQPC